MRIPPNPSSDNCSELSDPGIMSEDRAASDIRFHEVTDAELRMFQREKALLDADWKHEVLWTHPMISGEHNFAAAEMWQNGFLNTSPPRSKPYMGDQGEPEGTDPEPLPYMGARIRKGLAKLGVTTYGGLSALTKSEVLATKNMGQTSLTSLRAELATRGLFFRDEPIDQDPKGYSR